MKANYKSVTMLAAVALFSITSWGQTTLAQWNFNGTSDLTVPGGTTSPLPSTGTGTAQLVGGTTATFASGNSTTGTMETETTTPPNYAWNTTNYPGPGTGNKTAGVQFNVSTLGYSGITFSFEQRLSNKAGNTYTVQYTTNRLASVPIWVDAQTFTFTPAATGTGDTWYNDRDVNLSGVTALNNNANAAFRIVGAFDPSAGDYLAARSTSTYDGLGTVRYDMVTVTAATLGTNELSASRGFSVSPNPTSHGIVYLSEISDINVYDIAGKLIHSAQQTETIDTQAFNTGVYFVKTGTGLTTKLVVK